MGYKFNREQQEILKKAFGYKTFTKKLNDEIMLWTVDNLSEKLSKIGYRLKIQLSGK